MASISGRTPINLIVILHLTACFQLFVKADEGSVPLSKDKVVPDELPTSDAVRLIEPVSITLRNEVLELFAEVTLPTRQNLEVEKDSNSKKTPAALPVAESKEVFADVTLPTGQNFEREDDMGKSPADRPVAAESKSSADEQLAATTTAASADPTGPPSRQDQPHIVNILEGTRANWTLEQKILSVENYVCNSECGNSFPAWPSRTLPRSCQQCHCDMTCETYHTCCPDVVLNKRVSYQGIGADCVELIATGVNTSSIKDLNLEINVLSSMITKCHARNNGTSPWGFSSGADQFQADRRRMKCEYPDIANADENLPVSDTTTDVTYRNVYCAQCNNVSEEVLYTWSSDIVCDGNADLLLNSNPNRKELYNMLTSVEDVKRTGCSLVYKPTQNNFRRECRYPQQHVIQTCNETGLWPPMLYDSEIEKACHSYTSLFQNEYRNMFCFVCNANRTYDPGYLSYLVTDSDKAVFGRLSFSALVDFSDVSGGDDTKQKLSFVGQCDDGKAQFYDNRTCSCRDLHCSEGKEYLKDENTCRSFVTSNSIGYQACAQVEIGFYGAISMEDLERLEGFHRLNPMQVSYKLTASISNWCPGERSLGLNFLIHELAVFSYHSLEDMDKKFEQLGVHYCERLSQNTALGQVESCRVDYVDTCPENTGFTMPCDNDQTVRPKQVIIAQPRVYPDATLLKATSFITYRKTNRCAFVKIPPDDFVETKSMLRHLTSNKTIDKSKVDFFSKNSSIRLCLDDYLQWTQDNTSSCDEYGGDDTSFDTWTTAGLISVICSCVSLLFLFFTFVTYVLFDKIRSGGGKNIMTLTVTLFIAQGLYEFTIEQFENRALCSTFGVLIHYFWLASAFSMNACTVERFYKLSFPLRSRSFFLSKKPFTMATMWTFMCPLFIVCCNVAVNVAIKDDLGYGNSRLCYINERYSRILSFVAPLCAVVFFNVSLLIFTVIKLRRHSVGGNKKKSQTRIGLIACVRLSVVTGVTWIASLLYEAIPIPFVGYIFTALIGLQGVIFFFSIVVNKRVIDLYKSLLSSIPTKSTSSSSGSPAGQTGSNFKAGLPKDERELQDSPRVAMMKHHRLLESTHTSLTRIGSGDSGFVGGSDAEMKGDNKL